MIEYIRHIDEYFNYWQADFSKLVPSGKWGNKSLAEKYLQKYWLTEQEYLNVWKPIQNKIFLQDKGLPELVYHSEFDIIALKGGCLFSKESFDLFQEAMQEVDDEYFVVIQHSQGFTSGEPAFRMKYPKNITWEELISGNYISSVLLEMNYNEYFIFDESGKWGRYSANDYDHPVHLVGSKPLLSSVFRKKFKQTKQEKESVSEYLPQEYLPLLI